MVFIRRGTGGSQVLDRYAADPDVMSENNDPSPEVPEAPEAPEPDAPAKRTFRDRFAGSGERLRGTRGLIAATLAALIVGGFGGAAIHAAVDGDRDDHERFFRGDRPGEMGRDFGERGPDHFFRQAPGVPGQLPPTTTPSPSPSESSDS
jgi:hypothetical protein